MRRRTVLRLLAGQGGVMTAGCASRQESYPDAIFVHPDGNDEAPGTKEAPLGSNQAAFDRAQPGHTIHVLPGGYYEEIKTKRPGEPGNPITVTGSPDAILRGNPSKDMSVGFAILHSYIHIRGLTFNGLQDPTKPDEATSYAGSAIKTIPINLDYLDDLVFKPHAIGNTRGLMITLNYCRNVEIGEFRLIGPAGIDYKLGEKVGHIGEIVYVGQPLGSKLNSIGEGGEIGDQYVDETSNVHIHHIDASAGYHHIELVDVKAGSSDVTVEYCTSVDARLPTDNDNSSAVHVGGTAVTFRWNQILSPASHGITVGNYGATNDDIPSAEAPNAGKKNAIYGNKIVDSGAEAIRYTPEVSEAVQQVVCGNEYNGETHGNPDKPCPDAIPETDKIGHLGGDSPWA